MSMQNILGGKMGKMIDNYGIASMNLVAVLESIENVNVKEPHVKVASDLAITYRLRLDQDITPNTFLKVTWSMVNHWKELGYYVGDLLNDAMEATELDYPVMIQTLPEVMSNIFGVNTECNNEVLVVTTENMVRGAIALFYKNTINKLAKELKTNELIIVPSSIHEVLVMSRKGIDIDAVNAIIRNINETIVAPNERLANHCYIVERFDDGSGYTFYSEEGR